MPPADNRIAIRNKTTGETGHGISGHIPDGWEKLDRPELHIVKPAQEKLLAERSDTRPHDDKKTVKLPKRVPGMRARPGHTGGDAA